MDPQLGLFPRSPSQRVPALTEAMRLALDAVELAGGGALCERRVSRHGEEFPAAARIIMKGKQEYGVQGSVAEVTAKLEEGKK